MVFTTIGVTSELKQPEIVATNLVWPNFHISYDFYRKTTWYNPLSNKTYLLRTDDIRRQPNLWGPFGAYQLVLTWTALDWTLDCRTAIWITTGLGTKL